MTRNQSTGKSRIWKLCRQNKILHILSFGQDSSPSYQEFWLKMTFTANLGLLVKRANQTSAIRTFSSGGGKQRPIFVAATKQHVGKTTTSLAVLSGLQKRFDNVGFLKPVGQQHVKVDIDVGGEEGKSSIRVDKDVVLIKEHFNLDHIDYKYMSPVIIPKGYTRRFVDGEISTASQQRDVEVAAEQISSCSDITLIEGTGHCAVGSIVGLNNAKVANLLGADMVLM